MRELAPDADSGRGMPLDLTVTSQILRSEGHEAPSPHILERLLRSIERDGRDSDGGKGNIRLRKLVQQDRRGGLATVMAGRQTRRLNSAGWLRNGSSNS